MQLRYSILVAMVAFGLLSGCAYIQGRKDSQTTTSSSSGKSTTVTPEEQAPLPPAHKVNPSNNAAKMIAPLTSG